MTVHSHISKFSHALLALLLATGLCCAQQGAAAEVPWDDSLPPGTPAHVTRALEQSSRHGEYVDIALPGGAKLNAWVVYPERKDKAGVVLVIHDIRGMSDWIRAVGDKLAQDGFIAVVPDFLSGKGEGGGGTAAAGREVGQLIPQLAADEVVARLDAAMAYGATLPASNGKTGVIGFCWGGTQSFGYALANKKLAAAVVYYGSVPGASDTAVPEDKVALIMAPVLGLYAGDDARINATLPPTIAAMAKHGKSYEHHTFAGAGHGFLHRQDGAGGKNLAASQQAWPLTLTFLRQHLAAAGQAVAGQDQRPRATDPGLEAKVRELLDLTGAGQLGKQVMDGMLAQFQQMPGLSDGFVAAFHEQAKPEELVDRIVPIYTEHLDAATIDAALAFYKTEHGRKLLAV
jgi:carboxymethylenebutenolidase